MCVDRIVADAHPLVLPFIKYQTYFYTNSIYMYMYKWMSLNLNGAEHKGITYTIL